MAESEAILGFGCTFGVGNGANPEVFSVFAELNDVNPPEPTGDDEEVTHHGSPDGWKEFIPGLVDAGEASAQLNYKKSDVATILGLFRQRKNYQITLPDGSTWVFTGYLKKMGKKTPLKNKITQELGFKCSGKPVWAPAP